MVSVKPNYAKRRRVDDLFPAVWACLALVTTFTGVTARAAGFEYGPQGFHAVGRGGAFTVRADDPSAIYWNPSRLALLRGTRFHYSHNFPQENLTFRRSPGQPVDWKGDPSGDPVTFAPASETLGFFPLNASFAISSDFGLDDFTFALGMVGPSAMGKARFDDPDNQGATRYSFLNMDIALIFLTLSAAWRYRTQDRDWFGVGLSLQYAMIPWLRYSLMLVAPTGPTNQNGVANTRSDMRADLDMKDRSGFTAIFGAFVRPLPHLELAVSSRLVPIRFNASGNIRMSGAQGTEMIFKNMEPFSVPATLTFTYPMTAQVGARYFFERGGREIADVEVDFVWEHWSQLKSFDITFSETKLEKLGYEMTFKKLVLARNYQDTFSVRLGGQWNAIPKWLTVRAGGWWESPAHPVGYTMVDFPSFNRFGLAFGLSSEWRGVEIGFAYAHIFQQDRTVCVNQARIYQQILQPDGSMLVQDGIAPDPYPVNAGQYSGSFDVVTIGLNVHFDALFGSSGRSVPHTTE